MQQSFAEGVAQLVEFFGTRLLLKRFRVGNRGNDAPDAVKECEAEFTDLARLAVAQAQHGALDALEWVEYCGAFSMRWMEVCHWVSPKRFREFLSATIDAEWEGIASIPSDKELPPIHLKWYKNPDGSPVSQPYTCPACNVRCNSLLQYKTHAQGKSHKTQAKLWAKAHDGQEPEPVPYEGRRKGKKARKARMLSMTPSVSTAASPCASPRLTVETSPELRTALLCSPPITPSECRRACRHGSLCPSTGSCASMISCVSIPTHSTHRDSSDEYEGAEAEPFCETPTSSSCDLLQDSAHVIPSACVHHLRTVDSTTQVKLNKLDAVLARLGATGRGAEQALALVMQLKAVAIEQVAYSLVDAAMCVEVPAHIAAIASSLASADAGFHSLLVRVVTHLVQPGFAGLLEQVAPHGGEAAGLMCGVLVENEFQEHKARARYLALLAFVSHLVSDGLVAPEVLLACVRTALATATYDDITAAFRASTPSPVLARMDAACVTELRGLFAAALEARFYPKAIHTLLAPFLQRPHCP